MVTTSTVTLPSLTHGPCSNDVIRRIIYIFKIAVNNDVNLLVKQGLVYGHAIYSELFQVCPIFIGWIILFFEIAWPHWSDWNLYLVTSSTRFDRAAPDLYLACKTHATCILLFKLQERVFAILIIYYILCLTYFLTLTTRLSNNQL